MSDVVREFLDTQREFLADLGFRNPAVALQAAKHSAALEWGEAHSAEVLEEMRTRGCVDVVLGETSYSTCQEDLDARLEHLVQESEQVEAEVGLSLLKMTVGTVFWRDQDGVVRESALYFLPVRIVGDRIESTGPMEPNETFLARAAAAGLMFRLEPECWDMHSIVPASDPFGIFVGTSNRVCVDLFATMKLALAQSLDYEKWPELFSCLGILRLAEGFSPEVEWEVDAPNQYLVLADLRLAERFSPEVEWDVDAPNQYLVLADPGRDAVRATIVLSGGTTAMSNSIPGIQLRWPRGGA